jgi:hypothetical protein
MIAAIKKVLSPISDTMMTLKLAMKAWMKPRLATDFGGSSVVRVSSSFFRSVGGFTSSSSFKRKANF